VGKDKILPSELSFISNSFILRPSIRSPKDYIKKQKIVYLLVVEEEFDPVEVRFKTDKFQNLQ
jgi:hypothetical protein